MAPYIVDVIPANIKNEEQVKVAEEIYEALLNDGIEAMIDDRDERPGFKFKDADLIGFPFKVVSGKKAGEGDSLCRCIVKEDRGFKAGGAKKCLLIFFIYCVRRE